MGISIERQTLDADSVYADAAGHGDGAESRAVRIHSS